MVVTPLDEAERKLTGEKPPQVVYETRGQAAWIVLDRPEKRNALSPAMIAEIGTALDRAERRRQPPRHGDHRQRGKAFCAGADLDAGPSRFADAGDGPRHPFAELLQRLQTSVKPVIAAVNGPGLRRRAGTGGRRRRRDRFERRHLQLQRGPAGAWCRR